MLKLPNTTRLLLHCVQLSVTDNMRDEIEALVRQPIDWKAFEDAAMWHGIAPLAFNGLRNVQARQHLPAQLFESLKSEYRKNLIRNTMIFAELEKIVAMLGEQHVPVILLKGAAITRIIYKDIGLRPMSDIDILVKKEDLYQAVHAIEACGYHQHDRENLEQLLNTKYHVVYIHPDINVLLEIHWDITSDHNPSLVRSNVPNLMDMWWSRASNAESGFNNVFHLHPIDLICLLSSHFFKHRFVKSGAGFSTHGGILQLCDILNIVCFYNNEVTWDALAAEARRIGLTRTVNVALHVVKTLFADAIDDRIAFFDNLIIEPSDKAIAHRVVKRIDDMPDKHAPVPIGFIRADKTASYPDRIANIVRAAFPDPVTLSGRLNRPINSNWFYLNYLLRVFLLINNYGKTWFMRRHLKEEGVLRRWIDGTD
ncbi:MAG: nucleotidyltransferase family protein [Desulfosarcina sp.]|nr:nucleotidyltransferase family protein [Desulfosarcina sp.]